MTFLSPAAIDEPWSDGDDPAYCATGESPRPAPPPAASPHGDTDRQAGPLDDFWPHVPAVRRFLRRRVDAADIEDVLQDIFLNIIRRIDGSTVAHPRCYLFQAAQAAVVDRHRRQTVRRHSCHGELREVDAPVDERSPLRILMARDDIRTAEYILSELPQRTQEIIVAIRLEGMSLKSLASRYNISTSAIEKHVTRASRALSRVRGNDQAAARHGRCPRRPSIPHSI